MNPRSGETAEGHQEFKPVVPSPNDPLLSELCSMKGEDGRFDLLIDGIVRIQSSVLLEI
jgi:hypothetical protein